MRRDFARGLFNARVQQILLIVLLQVTLFATAASAQLLREYGYYWRSHSFEKEISELYPKCMPVSYQLVQKKYVFSFAETMIDQCVTANVTESQVRKYAVLITGTLLNPAMVSRPRANWPGTRNHVSSIRLSTPLVT